MQTMEGAKKAVKTILNKNPNHYKEAGRLEALIGGRNLTIKRKEQSC